MGVFVGVGSGLTAAQSELVDTDTLVTASLSSHQNTIADADEYGRILFTLGASIEVRSLPAAVDGKTIELVNTHATFGITLKHQSGSGTDELFTFADGLDVGVRPGGSILVTYDQTNGTWRQRASAQLGRAVPLTFLEGPATATTVAVSPAHTELASGVHRITADLTGCTQYYLHETHANTATAGQKYGVKYSLDNVTYNWLDGTSGASAPTAYADISQINVLNTGGAFTIVAAARTRVFLMAVFTEGPGSSQNFRNVGGYAF